LGTPEGPCIPLEGVGNLGNATVGSQAAGTATLGLPGARGRALGC